MNKLENMSAVECKDENNITEKETERSCSCFVMRVQCTFNLTTHIYIYVYEIHLNVCHNVSIYNNNAQTYIHTYIQREDKQMFT